MCEGGVGGTFAWMNKTDVTARAHAGHATDSGYAFIILSMAVS